MAGNGENNHRTPEGINRWNSSVVLWRRLIDKSRENVFKPWSLPSYLMAVLPEQGIPVIQVRFSSGSVHSSYVSNGCRFSGPSVRSRGPEFCSDASQSWGIGKIWKIVQRHIQSFFLNPQAVFFITCCRASFYFILPLKGKMRIRNPPDLYSHIIQNSIIKFD